MNLSNCNIDDSKTCNNDNIGMIYINGLLSFLSFLPISFVRN